MWSTPGNLMQRYRIESQLEGSKFFFQTPFSIAITP